MITVHLSGEDWGLAPNKEEIVFHDADMSDVRVREAFDRFVAFGLKNVNCVMEDSQSPINTDTRFTHPYTYTLGGGVVRFVYDDSHRQEHMASA